MCEARSNAAEVRHQLSSPHNPSDTVHGVAAPHGCVPHRPATTARGATSRATICRPLPRLHRIHVSGVDEEVADIWLLGWLLRGRWLLAIGRASCRGRV